MGSSRTLKLVVLGLAVIGFAMTLAIASLVWLLTDIDSALSNMPDRGGGPLFLVLLAIIAALGGLVVAYNGAMLRD